MISKVLAITTLACIIDSVFVFSLPVPLPPQPPTWITTLDCLLDSVIASSLPVPLPLQTTTRVTTLDWINDDPRCPSLIGFVCLYLDCITVYQTRSVKFVNIHLCLRVEHLNPPVPRTLQYELATQMDSADSDSLRAALQAQGRKLHQTEEQYNTLRLEMQGMMDRQERVHSQVGLLTNQFQQLMERLDVIVAPRAVLNPAPAAAAAAVVLPTAPSTAPSTASPRLSRPEKFSGDSGDCRPFLVQCGLQFEVNAPSFQTERAKVAYIMSHLSGRAEKWATAEWARNSHVCSSVQLFTETLGKIFNTTRPGREAARELMGIRQGNQSVSDYAIRFRTLATDSGWNEESLFDAFLYGLAEPIRDQLVNRDLPANVNSLIELTVKIDKNLQDRGKPGPDYSAPFQRGQRATTQQSW